MSNINVNNITPLSGDTISISGSLHISGNFGGSLNSTLEISSSKTYLSGSTSIPLGLGVTGSILPGENGVYDLGSPTHIWRELFLSENSLKFVSGSGEVTSISQEDAKQVFEGRKSSAGMPMKRIRGFATASTFIDLDATNQQAGDRIDIKVANTFEALSISTARVSLGPKETVPLELTGSLKVTPSYSDPHDLKGKYVFSGNPSNFGSAGTGIVISGSLDLSGSFANYSFENMSMDISQGGQLIYGALGVAMTGNSNVTIEEAVITQPGHISQSFNIGTAGNPSTTNMIGVGDNCYIKITEGVIIHVNEDSTFKIQCPQPDITINTDTDIITLSNGAGDETVISTGEFGTNPQYIASNYSVPAGNVAVWYGPIYIGRAAVPNSVGYLVTNLGSLRLNNNSQIRIQAF